MNLEVEFNHIIFDNERDTLILLDQRKLPREVWVEIKSIDDAVTAITSMVVRGAPAIGIVAAYSFYLGVKELMKENSDIVKVSSLVKDKLSRSRPTAVNLFNALSAAHSLIDPEKSVEENLTKLRDFADQLHKTDIEKNKKIASFGSELIPNNSRVLTHCNTGSLATGGIGTALGVIIEAFKRGKILKVWVDETRPRLQGTRLTAWELKKAKVPFEVIVDSAAGYLMANKLVDIVIVGADRVLADGQTANKIGTYSLAVLAKFHKIPFFVALPTSTFDLENNSIPVERRDKKEILQMEGIELAPRDTQAFNPAFDITPPGLISAFITDKGIIYPPYEKNIKHTITEKIKELVDN